jgi:hypothetical protein
MNKQAAMKPLPISDEKLREWNDRIIANHGHNEDGLRVAGELLWELYIRVDPDRSQHHLRALVTSLQAGLDNVIDGWKYGHYLHLEEAFGLSRPRGWHRAAVQKKAEHSYEATRLVREALARGAKTPDVFQEVYESGKLPENISASQIQKWYYEAKREYPELFPDRSQKKKPISEKKDRT